MAVAERSSIGETIHIPMTFAVKCRDRISGNRAMTQRDWHKDFAGDAVATRRHAARIYSDSPSRSPAVLPINRFTLLKTFADQAVIAIENVRLFKELKRVRWSSRRRRAEILGVIASSPTDIQPVLDAVAENAARLCGVERRADLGALKAIWLRRWRSYGSRHLPGVGETSPDEPAIVAWTGDTGPAKRFIFHDAQNRARIGFPAVIANSVARDSDALCSSVVARGNCHRRHHDTSHGGAAFHATQIELLETFADQAVIAIENVRLFKELASATRIVRRWSSRRRRAKFWASSPARRRIFSRCWTLLQRMRRGCVEQTMR